MRQSVVLALLATTLVAGCATKNYVRQNVQPVQAKVDQVADQTNKQGAQLSQTQQDVAKNTTAISAVDEKATGADRRAGEAMTSANQANQKSDRNSQEISQLRGVIANIDDYKVATQATVLFAFNAATLTKDDKAQLDTLASQTSQHKRFFVAVEGYTDQTGSANYNLELSKRRADAVVQYLAGERSVPFYEIRTIGLGEQQLADPGKTRDARAKNRRVEVKIYSADAVVAASASGNGGAN
jgi:outer membrane protein OmpA-like peptidoglycan-associated protein